MHSDSVDGPVSEVGQLVSTIATWDLALVVIALVARVCLRRRSWAGGAAGRRRGYGGGAVLVSEKLRGGWGAREVLRFYAANVALAVVAEVAYIQVLQVYDYQDSQPWTLLGYPMFLAFVNSVSPVVAGVLAFRLEGMLTGWWRLSLCYAVPVCFAMEAFGGGFLYLAYRHSVQDPNPVIMWALSALAAATAALMVKLVSQLAPAAATAERATAGTG